MTDVVGQIRLHADMVADGERPRAHRAVLIEFDMVGLPHLTSFGSQWGSNRDAIAALLLALTALNADAAN